MSLVLGATRPARLLARWVPLLLLAPASRRAVLGRRGISSYDGVFDLRFLEGRW
jgi:hypothetical protein